LYFRADGSLVSPTDVDAALPANFSCWHYSLVQTGPLRWDFHYVADHAPDHREIESALAKLIGEGARVIVILIGKSLVAFAIVLALRFPVSTAVLVSASLAQIGEFSFILAGLGMTLGLLPQEGRDLILAGALFSITLNPLIFSCVRPLSVLPRFTYGFT
jgi:hypothetical protein